MEGAAGPDPPPSKGRKAAAQEASLGPDLFFTALLLSVNRVYERSIVICCGRPKKVSLIV